MTTLAIIGTGIAGLGCAHFLHREYNVTLYEQNAYAGGHTNTVSVPEAGRSIPIDTGFMVYNEVTYPNLTRLFRELDVPTKPTCMSFSVQHRASGLEYSGASFGRLFGQRRNLFSPRFWRLLFRIDRFNREAVEALENPAFARQTVRDYVGARGYGQDFLQLFLVPMSSAVWSAPAKSMLDFPAVTLLRFFHNHGFLGMHTQHPWRTVVDGARSYVTRIARPWADRIRLGQRVARVERRNGAASVYTEDGGRAVYDRVIFASHADQTLRLLGDATPLESRLLSAFRYQSNRATLHSDLAVMPKSKRCWASWNYHIRPDSSAPSVHYWMNSLQGVSRNENYFVSLNADEGIDPAKTLRRIEYEHPVFTLDAIAVQKELPELNRIAPDQTTYFCGSYFRYGFHEDAFTSALECARAMTARAIWA